MTLPAPHLDDRTFQDIVDEAKRRIALRCPEWTDHNVSDPGVALIELFAWMTEMIIYRLNQVPDRLYVKFLELVGISLYSATPARTGLLFELTGPAKDTIVVRKGTRVGTQRDTAGDQIVFMTESDLRIVAPELVACRTRSGGGDEDRTSALAAGAARIAVFPSAAEGDALYLGFRQGLAGNLLRLDVTVADARGAGVDPKSPPRVWQSWDGRQWQEARVLADTSGGFNTTGRVSLLLAPAHEQLTVGAVTAYWVRCVLRRSSEKQPTYESSPLLQALTVTSRGGVVKAHHAEAAPAELLGTSSGRPGQSFVVRRAPVLPRTPDETVQVVTGRTGGTAESWYEVRDFTRAGPEDRIFTWSGATGEIRFGPRVTARNGETRQHGAIPPENAQIMVTGYRYGGGSRGNVGAGKLTVLLTSVPQVGSVRNLDPATGGVDAETVENAKIRGPLELRGGRRAVTARDFERLTLEGAPGVARARCLPPEKPGGPVRLLVVPKVFGSPRSLDIDQLKPGLDVVEDIQRHLGGRRLLTTQVRVMEPYYQGISIRTVVRAASTVQTDMVRSEAEEALYAFINPVTGGPDGRGWPFGHGLSIGDVYAVLNAVPGVAGVRSVEVFKTDLRGERAQVNARQEAQLPAGALFMSDRHTVEVSQ
ncbi:putative baseplate assembly protein [Streptomyces sp. NRRL S-118]|uniref:putative baseplate assembly protein n=1 Tax=Streptomyces sp. NRRL S-118 TaxID=1463881 RepID=UPI0004C861FE|nr:putative baseplate assembly protein [Streptomyces sp. NRRL S-118]